MTGACRDAQKDMQKDVQKDVHMKEYDVDLCGVENKQELFRRLRGALPLPQWTAANLDALYDVLTEYAPPVCLRFLAWEQLRESEPAYFDRFRRMLLDVQGEIPGFSVEFVENTLCGEKGTCEGAAAEGPERAASEEIFSGQRELSEALEEAGPAERELSQELEEAGPGERELSEAPEEAGPADRELSEELEEAVLGQWEPSEEPEDILSGQWEQEPAPDAFF